VCCQILDTRERGGGGGGGGESEGTIRRDAGAREVTRV